MVKPGPMNGADEIRITQDPPHVDSYGKQVMPMAFDALIVDSVPTKAEIEKTRAEDNALRLAALRESAGARSHGGLVLTQRGGSSGKHPWEYLEPALAGVGDDTVPALIPLCVCTDPACLEHHYNSVGRPVPGPRPAWEMPDMVYQGLRGAEAPPPLDPEARNGLGPLGAFALIAVTYGVASWLIKK